MANGEFGDVDEAFDAVFYADECAEGYELGDLTGYNLTQCVGASECLPGVFLGSLQ